MSQASAIVLLSGLLCDADIWAAQIDTLGAQHDVFCPGFMDQSSIGAMADDVLARAPSSFCLAGHSMGGRVALEIVRRAPERVERLALLATGHSPAKPGEQIGRYALVQTARQEGMRTMAGRWLPPMLAAARIGDAALIERLTAMVARANPDLFERQIQALLTRPNAFPSLGAIGCPTALVVGRQDTWSPLAQHEEMAIRIPESTVTVIEDSGHMSPVEQPQAVTAALRAWLTMEQRAEPGQRFRQAS